MMKGHSCDVNSSLLKIAPSHSALVIGTIRYSEMTYDLWNEVATSQNCFKFILFDSYCYFTWQASSACERNHICGEFQTYVCMRWLNEFVVFCCVVGSLPSLQSPSSDSWPEIGGVPTPVAGECKIYSYLMICAQMLCQPHCLLPTMFYTALPTLYRYIVSKYCILSYVLPHTQRLEEIVQFVQIVE